MDPVVSRLLISCPDRAGIVAATSTFLARRGANIVSSAQHTTDPSGGRFLMRMEFVVEGDGGDGGAGRDRSLGEAFEREVGGPFAMQWRLAPSVPRKRIAILASREEHCLLDLLWRWRSGELPAEVALVASNHEQAGEQAARFDVPFLHVPVGRDDKAQAEAALVDALRGERVELVVLARYMQILSGEFLDRVGCPVINIHHSFLPAFVGAEPYRQALDRGVKIIGATAHYVTEQLDAGPIIEQDVERVDHRYGVQRLAEVGQDIERRVLARAVRWHLDDRVLLDGSKTVVF